MINVSLDRRACRVIFTRVSMKALSSQGSISNLQLLAWSADTRGVAGGIKLLSPLSSRVGAG